MSHIRFNRTIRGTVMVSVPVHTEEGLRHATCEVLLEHPEKGLQPEEAKTAVRTLFETINTVRAEASKRKTEKNQ